MRNKPVSTLPPWALLQFLHLGSHLEFLPWLPFRKDGDQEYKQNRTFPVQVSCGHCVYHNRKNLQHKGWYLTATVKDPRNLTAKVNGTVFQAALNRETAEAAACWAVPSSKAKFITNRGKIPSLPVSWLDLEHLAVTGDCCLLARNPQKAWNLPLL